MIQFQLGQDLKPGDVIIAASVEPNSEGVLRRAEPDRPGVRILGLHSATRGLKDEVLWNVEADDGFYGSIPYRVGQPYLVDRPVVNIKNQAETIQRIFKEGV